jgi:HEAT repeat protein
MSNQATPAPLSHEEIKLLEHQREIKQCLIELHSNNPHHRSNAARRLGELKAEPEALLAAIDDPNGFVRSAAAEALGHAATRPNPEIIEALLSAIDDSNDYVCAAAVNSLGLLHVQSAIDQILPCLEDRNPLVVQAAILALARLSPPDMAEKLASFLDSEIYPIHLAAVRAVSLMGYKAAGEQIKTRLEMLVKDPARQDLKLARLYIDTLVRLETRPAIPLLIEIARNEVGLRSAGVEALIALNVDEAAPVLAPLLSDPSNKLRRHLVELMVRSNFKAVLPYIRPMLKEHAISLRETALVAISRWKDTASTDAVRWMCFHDPNPFVRPQAINTLVDLLGEEAVTDLVTLAQDVNLNVQRVAIYHLARARTLPPEARVILNRLAQSPDLAEAVRTALVAQPVTSTTPITETGTSIPLIPIAIQDDLDYPLDRLQTWQADLPVNSREIDLNELARLDEALSTLVTILKRNSNPPGSTD